MKKKCYDFRPDVLNVVLTAIFSVFTAVLMFFSINYEEGYIVASSVSKRGFLFTPAGCLIVLCCITILVLAIQSLRNQTLFPYILVPVSVAGILFALRSVLIQGDISLFLELSGTHLFIALIRSLLGILVIILLLLLVTNVILDKRYLMLALVVSIGWYFGTEGFMFYEEWNGHYFIYDRSQTAVLFSQISYYFSVMFFTFNIKPVTQGNGYITNRSGE